MNLVTKITNLPFKRNSGWKQHTLFFRPAFPFITALIQLFSTLDTSWSSSVIRPPFRTEVYQSVNV